MIDAAYDRALLESTVEPFADPVVRLDAQRDPPCHVDSLHGGVRAALHRAIASVGDSRRARMVLVHGDPGQGKTHELARLRADARNYYFLEIPPLKDASSPLQHVQRYAAQTLVARREIDRFLWQALRRVAETVLAAAREDGDDETTRALAPLLDDSGSHYIATFQQLARENPTLGRLLLDQGSLVPPLSEVDPDVARVLCRIADPSALAAARSWLRAAELPDDDLRLLGVRHSLDTEDRAFRALSSLARIAPRPLALCFDQLEATRDLLGPPGVLALFNAVMEIYQQLPVCVVLMCQTQVWAELLPLVPQAALERIDRPIALSPPTAIEAQTLIEGRLEPLWRGSQVTPPYASYPFAPSWLGTFVDEVVPSVRRVVQECAVRFADMRAHGRVTEVTAGDRARPAPAVEDAMDALDAEHRRKTELVRDREELRLPELRQQRVRSALERWLSACARAHRAIAGATIMEVAAPTRTRGPLPPLVVTLGRAGARRARLALDVHSDDVRGVYPVLERLHHHVCDGRADVGVLLREAAVPLKPSATRTLELARTLEPRGGIVYLDEGPVDRLIAAELLLDAVAATEVWAGEREITSAEALTWLVERARLDVALESMVGRLSS